MGGPQRWQQLHPALAPRFGSSWSSLSSWAAAPSSSGGSYTPRSSSGSRSSTTWAAAQSSSGHKHNALQLKFVGGVGGTQRRQLRHALRLKFEVLVVVGVDVGGLQRRRQQLHRAPPRALALAAPRAAAQGCPRPHLQESCKPVASSSWTAACTGCAVLVLVVVHCGHGHDHARRPLPRRALPSTQRLGVVVLLQRVPLALPALAPQLHPAPAPGALGGGAVPQRAAAAAAQPVVHHLSGAGVRPAATTPRAHARPRRTRGHGRAHLQHGGHTHT